MSENEQKIEKKEKPIGNKDWKKYENFVSVIGKWAWLILIIDALIYIIWGIWGLSWTATAANVASTYGAYSYVAADIAYLTALYTWYIIGGIILIILAIVIIKRRFSDKCAAKDWDYLLNDVLIIGKYRIPWMLIWGILAAVFGQWWAGFFILLPAILIIFWGPEEYQWKV
ncbi:MAG: hypothetical protein ACTSQP_05850 [Promethearchaeota archaeon]